MNKKFTVRLYNANGTLDIFAYAETITLAKSLVVCWDNASISCRTGETVYYKVGGTILFDGYENYNEEDEDE